ncbi:MAG TPA: hypothetical protein VEM93_03890, partial [Actinomycetota bacterium]|nr:hypothetical protein [Actinomycetota bacterium]
MLVEQGVVEERYDAVKEVLERRGTVTAVLPHTPSDCGRRRGACVGARSSLAAATVLGRVGHRRPEDVG